MDDSKWERWSALGGIAFVVLILISAFIPGSPPKTSDSAAKIAKFVGDHPDALRWGAYIAASARCSSSGGSGAVWRTLRRAEGGEPRLTVVAIAGVVFGTALFAVNGVLLAMPAILGVKATGGPEGTKFFYVFATNLGAGGSIGVAVFVGAFSAVILRSGTMPKAIGFAGGLVAVLDLVGAASVSSTKDALFVIGFIGFFATLLWVIAVSVLMYRGAGSKPASAGSAA